MKGQFDKLLTKEDEHLKKLHQIVLDSVNEEKLLANKIYQPVEKRTFSEKLSDKVAEFGGSWKFIIFFLVFMMLWIFANVYFLHNKGYDPYPFILLNLILSCIAALQAPIIMMSQNRKEDRDRQRAMDDYMINLKAEIEIRNLHQKVDLLIVEEMKNLFDIQRKQMEVLEKISGKLK